MDHTQDRNQSDSGAGEAGADLGAASGAGADSRAGAGAGEDSACVISGAGAGGDSLTISPLVVGGSATFTSPSCFVSAGLAGSAFSVAGAASGLASALVSEISSLATLLP